MESNKKEISVSEFKKHCLHLMDEIKNKNMSLTITKRKSPIAKITPINNETESKSFFGCMSGMLTVRDDIVNFTTQSEWEVNND